MSRHSVSVVVPTRNRARLLAIALRSVVHQADVDLEVIVIDEASQDDVRATVAALGDARVRVIRHATPQGVAAARNRGASLAGGEWLAFLDDDDLWAPDKLASQLGAAVRAHCDWAYVGSVNIAADGEIVFGRPPLGPAQVMAALPRYNAVPGGGSNVVVRRALWMRAGGFDTRLRNTEDWEMWIRLAQLGPPACVPLPLMGYRVHETNASLDVDEIIRGTRLIERLHRTRADWGRLHRWLAESCLRRGQRGAALGQYGRAAVRGDLGGVVSDIRDILRRRLAPAAGRQAHTAAISRDPWSAAAAVWLRHLHATVEAPGATPPRRRADERGATAS